MGILAEGIDKVIGYLPGFYKFDKNGLFSQAVLTITPDSIFIYDDNAPDEVNGANWKYNIKTRISFSDISLITNEISVNKSRVKNKTFKLVIKTNNDQEPITFFYLEKNDELALNLMAGFKRYKVKTKTNKTKLVY